MEIILIGIAIIIGLFSIYFIYIGAIGLFVWAMESGFIGLIAYIASWVFLFPIMLGLSWIVGLMGWWASW